MRMKTKNIWRIAFTILAVFTLAACTDDDGDWSPMKWKAEGGLTQDKGGYYEVAGNGGICKFTCTNYKRPWLSHANADSQTYQPDYDPEPNFHRIHNEWFEAEITNDVLTVTFKENTTHQERELHVTVTAGDIFKQIHFRQKAD